MSAPALAIVYDARYPHTVGGAEKGYAELARALGTSCRVTFVSMRYPPDVSKPPTAPAVAGVCPALPLYTASGRRSLREMVVFSTGVLLHLLLRRYDAVLVGGFPYLPCLAARAALWFRPRTRLIVHWFEVMGEHQWREYAGGAWWLGAWLERAVARLRAHHAAISPFTARRWAALRGAPAAAVLPFGIDASEIRRAAAGDRKPQILYAGRLARHKQVDMLLEAFARVARSPAADGVMLRIVGEGPDGPRLRSLAGRLGIAERTVFSPFLERSSYLRELGTSYLLVLPSRREGQGLVVLEAMAAGTPAVVFRSPDSAAADLITDGVDGVLFDDAEHLAQLLERLLRDDRWYRRLVGNARERVADFDWTAVVPRYRTMLAAGHASSGQDR